MLNHPLENRPPMLRPQDMKRLVVMARDLIGITIDESKTDFLIGRLGRRLAASGLSNYDDYCKLLKQNAQERVAFGEALTTHTTSFFREKAQYDWLLSDGLPSLFEADAAKKEIRVWSAASSTGQEGYTALMVLHQARDRGLNGLVPRLLGTDISGPVVNRARAAIYSQQEIEGIPIELRRRFLLSSKSTEGVYRISPELRNDATWRQGNLVNSQGLDGIVADVIFLRNVLIYFDDEMRSRIVENVYRRLKPGGILMTGHTEAALARHVGLKALRPSIFRKVVP